jgi:4-hydroxy-3-polyprenylbenzoate decarboxylase
LLKPKDNLWDKLKLLPKLKEVSEWMPRKLNRKGKCQELRMENPDLSKLPILKCWPADGGSFITLPGVHTVDPETGAPNVGMYRMQVFDNNLTGMHWHKHKTGANHFEKYKKLGKKMPVSVSLGGDLAYTYAATAPMPENIDEYLLAGFLRKKPVKLVKCITNNLYVPEDSDFVIEGFVDPAEELIWEGPFGDHTGFYSLADWYPKFHVTCITHRKDAVYPATIVGVPPMEDAYIGLATERIFLTPIRMSMIPELKDMTLPVAGVAHNFTVVKIEKSYPGQAIKVMSSLWGAGQMMFNKVLIVTDATVNIHEPAELAKAFVKNFDPGYSMHFSKGPLDVLDHSSNKFAFGSKLGIDLTEPFPEEISEEKSSDLPVEDIDLKKLKSIPEISGFNDLRSKSSLPCFIGECEKR